VGTVARPAKKLDVQIDLRRITYSFWRTNNGTVGTKYSPEAPQLLAIESGLDRRLFSYYPLVVAYY
jgi:hypothetical protein